MKFTYNNSYHSSLDMLTFEALYCRKCRMPICQEEVEERKLLGPKLVRLTMDNIRIMRANLKAAQDKQQSYTNLKLANINLIVVINFF